MKRLPNLRNARLLVLALAALSLASCLSARQRDFVRYDAAKDEFQMLMLLEDIQAKEPDDLAYLEGIYKNRDHLIAPVIPAGGHIFPLFAISLVRVSDKQFSNINFFSTRPTDFEVADSPVPLDAVKVTAGTFFLQDNKLGYYQAITVPGKTIDLALVELSKMAQTDDMVKGIQAEIDRRAAGGKVIPWAEVQAELVKQIKFSEPAPAERDAAAATTGAAPTPATPATQPADPPNPLMAMEVESLNRLKQAVTAKTVKIERAGQTLKLALPVTAKDATAVADLYKAAMVRIDETIRTAPNKPEDAEKLAQAKAMQAALQKLTVNAGAESVTASLDVVELIKSMEPLSMARIDMNDKPEPGAAVPARPDPIAYLRGKNIPLDATLTAEQIIRDFNAGTLKAFPSATPVKPGEGIVAPK